MMMMMMMHGPCAVPVWDSYVEGFPSVKCCLLQAMKARSRFGAWVCAGLLGCLTASGSNLCPTVWADFCKGKTYDGEWRRGPVSKQISQTALADAKFFGILLHNFHSTGDGCRERGANACLMKHSFGACVSIPFQLLAKLQNLNNSYKTPKTFPGLCQDLVTLGISLGLCLVWRNSGAKCRNFLQSCARFGASKP